MKYLTTSIVIIASLAINLGYIHIATAAESENSRISEVTINQRIDRDDVTENESSDDSDDIETEVGQVMNQASQDSQNDLRDQVKQVENTTKQKGSLRDGKSSETPTVPTPKDPNIISVIADDSHVEMDYKQPAKLFWFIPVQLLVHSSVDATGRVKVTFPWLARLANINHTQVDAAVAAENAKLDSLGEMSEEQQLKLQLTMDQRSKFEEMLSNIMKKMNEATEKLTANSK